MIKAITLREKIRETVLGFRYSNINEVNTRNAMVNALTKRVQRHFVGSGTKSRRAGINAKNNFTLPATNKKRNNLVGV